MAEERMLNDEILLGLIKANGGGGGGGTTDYEDLDNKPQIGGVTLSGNKSLADLGIASATTVSGILDGTDIDSFADVETALAGKQNALTAGDYISLNNGNIAVNRNLVGDNYDYEIKSTGDYKLTIIKSQGGTVISTNTYDYSYGTSTNIDNNFTIAGAYSGGNTWVYTALKDSTTHSVGYTWTKSVDASFEETESFPSEDLSGYKLVIKSEMDTALSGKQDATDNSLETTDKTIVGAINEHEGDISSLKSGLTNLDNEVNGDATTYPYADVITIEDAVPSNLADCTVKIEPDQDLHGYDHPWVGGAGKNKWKFGDFTDVHQKEPFSLPAGTYTVSKSGPDIGFRFFYDESNSIAVILDDIDSATFTLSSDCVSVTYSCMTGTATNVQIEEGSTATDYAPYENICPITGHTEASVQRDGRNRCDNSTNIIGFYGHDGVYSASSDYKTSALIPVSPNTSYTASVFDTTTNQRVNGLVYTEWDAYGNFIGQTASSVTSITTTANTKFIRVRNYNADTTLINSNHYAYQVELGSSATDYVPYAGQTYTIALGDTIYGGTVDFDSGVMTVTHGKKALNTFSTWGYDQSHHYMFATASDVKTPINNDVKANINSDSYNTETANTIINESVDYGIALSSSGYLIVSDARYTDATAYITDMGSSELCYELATPFTVQLTPQQIQLLKGQNTLTASTGDISVTVNGVSGAIGSLQTQANTTDEALAELAEKLPTAPTTDGAYVLTVTVADGTPTYSWESAT